MTALKTVTINLFLEMFFQVVNDRKLTDCLWIHINNNTFKIACSRQGSIQKYLIEQCRAGEILR